MLAQLRQVLLLQSGDRVFQVFGQGNADTALHYRRQGNDRRRPRLLLHALLQRIAKEVRHTRRRHSGHRSPSRGIENHCGNARSRVSVALRPLCKKRKTQTKHHNRRFSRLCPACNFRILIYIKSEQPTGNSIRKLEDRKSQSGNRKSQSGNRKESQR